MTLEQHLAENMESIKADAKVYAKQFTCSYEIALRETIDAYSEGFADAVDAALNGDWDLVQS